ncbi:hypothetical protein TNCV_3322301 [Trichonephila clavipes]|nr:hypothetical protein TNCV_3322301 [Trichonephila clavipes]
MPLAFSTLFSRAKIALSPVWCSRLTTGVPLAHILGAVGSLVLTCRNCGGGDRGRVASIVPSGNLAELKSHCHLYGAQGQRQAHLLPIFLRAVGSLVVRASGLQTGRPGFDARCHQRPSEYTEYVLVKSVGP